MKKARLIPTLVLALTVTAGSTLCLSQTTGTTSGQEPVNPQSEGRWDSPLVLPLFPPSKLKADLASDEVKLQWTAIPLDRVKGYVVYEKNTDGWRRAGFVARPPFVLKATDGVQEAEFSVSTVDKTGLESKKSAPVKVSHPADPPPAPPASADSPHQK